MLRGFDLLPGDRVRVNPKRRIKFRRVNSVSCAVVTFLGRCLVVFKTVVVSQ